MGKERVNFLGKKDYILFILIFVLMSCGGEGSTVVGNPPATTVSNPKKITIGAIKDGQSEVTVPTALFGSNGNLIDLAKIQVVVNTQLKETLSNLTQLYSSDRSAVQFKVSNLVQGDIIVIIIVINERATEAFEGTASEEESSNGDLLDRDEISDQITIAEPDLGGGFPDDIEGNIGNVDVNVLDVDVLNEIPVQNGDIFSSLRNDLVRDFSDTVIGSINFIRDSDQGHSFQAQPYHPKGAMQYTYRIPFPDNICRMTEYFSPLDVSSAFDLGFIYSEGFYSLALIREDGVDPVNISTLIFDSILFDLDDLEQNIQNVPHHVNIGNANLSVNNLGLIGDNDVPFMIPGVDRAFTFTPLSEIRFNNLPEALPDALDVTWDSNRDEEIRMLTVDIIMTRSFNIDDGFVALSCHLDHDSGDLSNIVNRQEVINYLESLDFIPSVFWYVTQKYQPLQMRDVDFSFNGVEDTGKLLFMNATGKKRSYSNGMVDLGGNPDIDNFIINNIFPIIYEGF